MSGRDTALAELRRRLPDVELVERMVAGAGPAEAVLWVHPDLQHLAPPEQRHADGVAVRWSEADVARFLYEVGAEATACKVLEAPPAGCVWVAWIGWGCAVAAPWPRRSDGDA